jgi:DNA-binding MarR family transcriptional regulator
MTDTRWLTAREQEAWRAYVLSTRRLWSELERDMQRTGGMPLTYYEILSTLSEAPNRALRMAELSSNLQVSPSRLSHAVARLEENGFVRREVCPSDRRGWIATLTEEGFARLLETAPVHVESVRRHLFDHLTHEQVDELRAISRALLEHPQ